MQQALIDIEDSRFYKHHGVDYKGILRAAVHNQQAGDVQQGGSTLTQQYVKNVLIESAKTEAERKAATQDTLSRKLKEARLALALEKRESKQWILIHYLNIAYFGDGAYGIGAAAQHYFGVPVNRINVVQAAMLAGLVRNPTAYDPLQNPKDALTRRNTVLARMHQLGHLSTKVYKYALTFPLLLHPDNTTKTADSCQDSYAPFYCRYVVDQLLNDPKFGVTADDRQRTLFSGGLTIQTTLDPTVQTAAQNAVNQIVPSRQPGGRSDGRRPAGHRQSARHRGQPHLRQPAEGQGRLTSTRSSRTPRSAVARLPGGFDVQDVHSGHGTVPGPAAEYDVLRPAVHRRWQASTTSRTTAR